MIRSNVKCPGSWLCNSSTCPKPLVSTHHVLGRSGGLHLSVRELLELRFILVIPVLLLFLRRGLVFYVRRRVIVGLFTWRSRPRVIGVLRSWTGFCWCRLPVRWSRHVLGYVSGPRTRWHDASASRRLTDVDRLL